MQPESQLLGESSPSSEDSESNYSGLESESETTDEVPSYFPQLCVLTMCYTPVYVVLRKCRM